MCIFESDTVKSDCPMPENYEIFKDLIQTVGLLYLSITVCSGVIKKKKALKKKALKMTSQLVIFRAFFLLFFHISIKKKIP